MPRHPFSAVNLISDPIHGYVELTKRLTADESARRRPARRGRRRGGPARHRLAPAAAPDQPAPERPLGLPDRRALAVHPRPGGDARGRAVGARALPVAARGRWRRAASRRRARAWSSRRSGSPGSSTTSATGRSPTSSTTTSSPPSPRRRIRAGPPASALTHEDLSQLIIERELGDADRRPAPGARGRSRSATPSPTASRSTRAGSRSSSRKPALADPAMPRWVRWLQPLLSGVFTVDNLDYVRRDAWMTGVAIDVDVERLRRYAFIGERGLTLYEPGLGALEMFLTSRLFLYQQVYFHRTVRAIDLDLAEVFGPSIRAIFGDRSPAERARRLRRPRRVRAPPPGRPLDARRGRWRRHAARRRRHGDAGRRRGLAGDPAPPAALAVRGRGPRSSTRPAPGRTHEIAALGGRRAGPGRDRPRGRRRPAGRRDGDRFAARGRGPRRVVAVAGPVARAPARLRD